MTGYRQLELEDSVAVAALCAQMGYVVDESDVAKRLDAIGGRPDHRLIGAHIEGQLVGWVHVHADWSIETGHEAELHGMVVDERQRGLGIGRALIDEAAAWAFEKNCTRLRVRTNLTRLRAGDFYRRAGFREVKQQLVLDLPLPGTEAQP
jgi:GNAT superfamily N-acetyltransferase